MQGLSGKNFNRFFLFSVMLHQNSYYFSIRLFPWAFYADALEALNIMCS